MPFPQINYIPFDVSKWNTLGVSPVLIKSTSPTPAKPDVKMVLSDQVSASREGVRKRQQVSQTLDHLNCMAWGGNLTSPCLGSSFVKPEPIIYSSPRAIVKVTLELCLAYKHHANVSLHRNSKTLRVKRDGEGTKNVYYFQIIFMYCFFVSSFFFGRAVFPLVGGSVVLCGFSDEQKL